MSDKRKIVSALGTRISPAVERDASEIGGRLPKPQLVETKSPELPASRTHVSPAFLSVLQSLLMPAGMVLAAVIAKFVWLDLRQAAPAPLPPYVALGILGAIVLHLASRTVGLQEAAAIRDGRHRLGWLAAALIVAVTAAGSLAYALGVAARIPGEWFVVWLVAALTLLTLMRLGLLLWAQLLRAESRLLPHVAIYGSPDLAETVRARLATRDPGITVIGIFSDDADVFRLGNPATVAGGVRELVAAAQRGACDRVILAMPHEATDRIAAAMTSLDALPVEVYLSSPGLPLPGARDGSEEVLLLEVQRRPLSDASRILKAVMDYVIGATALVLLAPVMAVIAIAIKLDTPGPVFFRQQRHGYNHRIIRVYKFRSMTVTEDGPHVKQAERGDKRVTRVGRFLRRTSLDEIPQLINVVRGELSLVGPRPHAVAHNDAYAQILARYASRHKVKPGITGLAQVNGFRGETKTVDAMRQRLELDLQYIETWSPWLDLTILVRTLVVPFRSENAY